MALIFSQDSSVKDSLALPVGRYYSSIAINPGSSYLMNIEQTVNPEDVLEAAQALLGSGKTFAVATQAGVIVKAQQEGLAFTDSCKMNTL